MAGIKRQLCLRVVAIIALAGGLPPLALGFMSLLIAASPASIPARASTSIREVPSAPHLRSPWLAVRSGYVLADHADRLVVRQEPAPPQATGRFLWPTAGTLTQGFWRLHLGIDVSNREGTELVAADAGRVTWSGWGAYGLYVEIDHGNGFVTLYGHLLQADVGAGQPVQAGQPIGLMGSTGNSTGPHLHFEIRYQGVPQNPLRYLPAADRITNLAAGDIDFEAGPAIEQSSEDPGDGDETDPGASEDLDDSQAGEDAP